MIRTDEDWNILLLVLLILLIIRLMTTGRGWWEWLAGAVWWTGQLSEPAGGTDHGPGSARTLGTGLLAGESSGPRILGAGLLAGESSGRWSSGRWEFWTKDPGRWSSGRWEFWTKDPGLLAGESSEPRILVFWQVRVLDQGSWALVFWQVRVLNQVPRAPLVLGRSSGDPDQVVVNLV